MKSTPTHDDFNALRTYIFICKCIFIIYFYDFTKIIQIVTALSVFPVLHAPKSVTSIYKAEMRLYTADTQIRPQLIERYLYY